MPPAAELEALQAHVRIALRRGSRSPAAPSALEHPSLSAAAPSVTGVLMVLVGGAGDYVAFFRNEMLRKVDWLGDQTSANRQTPLSPRTSFSSWSGSVTGTAEPWGEIESEAAELARDLEGALLRKAESALAHLANHDPLTGLPNRRRLMEQLDLALRMENAESRLSLLFIDLDDFKTINDSFGHDVGDALITLVGQRICSATRDERHRRPPGRRRVRRALPQHRQRRGPRRRRAGPLLDREPVTVDGVTFAITASVGAAVTGRDMTASELLRRADSEMYTAKLGRKRVLRQA